MLLLELTETSASVDEAVSEADGLAGLDRPALNQAVVLRTRLSDQLVTWLTKLGGPMGMTVIAASSPT